ncbi:MAG TPA: hypothetical protein VN742_10265 [Candidatus Binataceae bacterium]|jgi:hypothetical protein|nr:hypothetical protein [Candidatus Binataceae bacterium]
MDRIGLLMGFRGMLCAKSSAPQYGLRGLKVGGAAALVVVLALALQGCSDSSQQSSEFDYGSASDYATYGYYNDPFAFAPYDPLLYSYWYPQPYYYYPNYAGDNDHDCDDGYCGHRGSHRLPSPIYPRPLTAPRPLTTTRQSSGGGFSSDGGNGSVHSGFNGAGGLGSHGSSHR